MSRRKLQQVKIAVQRGASLDDARKEARELSAERKARRKPYVMRDRENQQKIATLSVRWSRAQRVARLYRGARITWD